MKILYKVLAIIGILSFFGGLMNGVVFVFGLIVAGVFAFLGWKPEKPLNAEKMNLCTNNLNVQSKVDKRNELQKRLELLELSYEQGILNEVEFIEKRDLLKTELEGLHLSIEEKRIEDIILRQNSESFENLKKLLEANLLSTEEYESKRRILLQKLKKEFDPVTERKKSEMKDLSVAFSIVFLLIAGLIGFIWHKNKKAEEEKLSKEIHFMMSLREGHGYDGGIIVSTGMNTITITTTENRGVMTYGEAQNYCKKLTVNGNGKGKWRLPYAHELEKMINYNYYVYGDTLYLTSDINERYNDSIIVFGVLEDDFEYQVSPTTKSAGKYSFKGYLRPVREIDIRKEGYSYNLKF